MTRIRLPYVHEFTARHGKPRYYFRRAGFKQVRLPRLPGSTEFMEAYQAAVDSTAPVEIAASHTKPGTINCEAPDFLRLANTLSALYPQGLRGTAAAGRPTAGRCRAEMSHG
jgi:hypothetical protein